MRETLLTYWGARVGVDAPAGAVALACEVPEWNLS